MKQEKNTYIKNNSFLDLDIKSKGSINNIDHRVKNIFQTKNILTLYQITKKRYSIKSKLIFLKIRINLQNLNLVQML